MQPLVTRNVIPYLMLGRGGEDGTFVKAASLSPDTGKRDGPLLWRCRVL
jgi:hypothetical protein